MWTIGDIVEHVKKILNDNGSGTGLLLSAYAERFERLFVENVDHSSFLTSASLTLSDTLNYNLGYNYCRPLDEKGTVVKDKVSGYLNKRLGIKLRTYGGSQDVSSKIVYLIKGNPLEYFSAYIGGGATGETLEYWYFRYNDLYTSSSQYPLIPTDSMIDGIINLYKYNQREIPFDYYKQTLKLIFSDAGDLERMVDDKVNNEINNCDGLVSDTSGVFSR